MDINQKKHMATPNPQQTAALQKIEQELKKVDTTNFTNFCPIWKAIEPEIKLALPFLATIQYGPVIVLALKILMPVADKYCSHK
jgi:hypothetical protein